MMSTENKEPKRTFLGKLWRGIVKNNIPLGDTLVSVIDGGNPIEILDAVKKDTYLTQEHKDILLAEMDKDLKEQELDMKDRASARGMQSNIATSTNSTELSKNFIYYLASFWSIVGGLYIFAITFFELENTRAADTVLGFLLGTIVSTIITFFFGSNVASKDQNDASVAKKLGGLIK